ncbi:hypothetical protein PYCC9005_003848 [Savitreella phatthalungensis]
MAAVSHLLAKRSNFASREPGVILVFVIVGIVALGLIFFQVMKAQKRRSTRREAARLRSEQ